MEDERPAESVVQGAIRLYVTKCLGDTRRLGREGKECEIFAHASRVHHRVQSYTQPLAGHSVSLIVFCAVSKHADETAYSTVSGLRT